MKVHEILCEHRGENAPTPRDPVAVWRGQADLSETKKAFADWDFDLLVDIPKYEVRQVELPDWLDPEEWLVSWVEWKYLWGYGVDKNWSEAWQRGLMAVGRQAGREALLVCVQLLKTEKFRSEFRKSLRDQLVAWLETPDGERKYPMPFSRKQFECLITRYVEIEAWRIGERLYADRKRIA